jgi:hypothetical protein
MIDINRCYFVFELINGCTQVQQYMGINTAAVGYVYVLGWLMLNQFRFYYIWRKRHGYALG